VQKILMQLFLRLEQDMILRKKNKNK